MWLRFPKALQDKNGRVSITINSLSLSMFGETDQVVINEVSQKQKHFILHLCDTPNQMEELIS